MLQPQCECFFNAGIHGEIDIQTLHSKIQQQRKYKERS